MFLLQMFFQGHIQSRNVRSALSLPKSPHPCTHTPFNIAVLNPLLFFFWKKIPFLHILMHPLQRKEHSSPAMKSIIRFIIYVVCDRLCPDNTPLIMSLLKREFKMESLFYFDQTHYLPWNQKMELETAFHCITSILAHKLCIN